MRADAGLKILAYGWNAEKERVFTVAEMDDPQTVQKMMQTPEAAAIMAKAGTCLLYTSPSPRDVEEARMTSSA